MTFSLLMAIKYIYRYIYIPNIFALLNCPSNIKILFLYI